MENSKVIPIKVSKCPMCSNKSNLKFNPFCSSRCSQLDLSNWLCETYRIPAYEPEDLTDDYN